MDNNTLSKFVKTIGDKAVKERRKTNHNARKTTVTLLVNAVVPPIYPSFANKRSQKRPVLYIINNYSYASNEQLNKMSKILSMSLLETTIIQQITRIYLDYYYIIADACKIILENVQKEIENDQNFKMAQFC